MRHRVGRESGDAQRRNLPCRVYCDQRLGNIINSFTIINDFDNLYSPYNGSKREKEKKKH